VRHRWAALGLALALAACTSASPSGSPSPLLPDPSTAIAGATGFRPTYATLPCPDEITIAIINEVECGNLTVLEDRSKPGGRTIRLFVVKVAPPGGTDHPEELGPGPGDNIAAPRDFGGDAPGAQRAHRNLYLMDMRGVGRSEPNLDCPEVHAAASTLVGLRLGDLHTAASCSRPSLPATIAWSAPAWTSRPTT
jgi:hypothetical protein